MKKLLLLLLLMPCVAIASMTIPDAIKVPQGQVAYLTVAAKGQQIYQCSFNQGQYTWQIQVPDAQLFDSQGQTVGKHFKGPIWEYKEGSQVQGKIISRADMAPTAISWMLVQIISHKGDSIFTKASYINRINTQGGLPPTLGCDGNHLGSEKRVNYTADYVFFQPK